MELSLPLVEVVNTVAQRICQMTPNLAYAKLYYNGTKMALLTIEAIKNVYCSDICLLLYNPRWFSVQCTKQQVLGWRSWRNKFGLILAILMRRTKGGCSHGIYLVRRKRKVEKRNSQKKIVATISKRRKEPSSIHNFYAPLLFRVYALFWMLMPSHPLSRHPFPL